VAAFSQAAAGEGRTQQPMEEGRERSEGEGQEQCGVERQALPAAWPRRRALVEAARCGGAEQPPGWVAEEAANAPAAVRPPALRAQVVRPAPSVFPLLNQEPLADRCGRYRDFRPVRPRGAQTAK
jgi:hypothetical protein